ncbi:FAD-binding protein [Actinospica sp.]|uniref:FAD-binding protein n=1 Tax=Actinospica sp. TaxID=1872142 RepID=UPI002BE63330|nr:FAD-binding protein [Actinospica sp.]HWG26684.1 FAD-binding protein [Actinospica sp.]
MGEGASRRGFLLALAGAAVVTGFDPGTRAWATTASDEPSFAKLPPLDGKLLLPNDDLAPYEDDYGHIIHRTPVAVLLPGSVEDVATLIRFAGPLGIPVAPRGQGHQTYGQAQVSSGVVIDMSTLDSITVDPAGNTVTAQAGALWHAVLTDSVGHGLTPPVFPDYIELSVGGTLSVGGFGGASSHFGAQVDTVTGLQVVTGAGEIVRCSATEHRDVFEAVLGGLGQFGVITRASIALVPAPQMVREYTLAYPTVAALTADQRKTIGDGRFNWLEGQLSPSTPNGWDFALEGAVYYDASEPPVDATVLEGLSYTGTPATVDSSYADFVNQLAPAITYLESTGEWYDPHPWVNLFLPDTTVDTYMQSTLANLTASDIGSSGVVLLYPVPTRLLTRPFVRTPDGDLAFLFALLRTASPDTDSISVAEALARNRTLYDNAVAVGATQYPIGSIPDLTSEDWARQYGPELARFDALKRRFDPHRVMTPGQGVFAPSRSAKR